MEHITLRRRLPRAGIDAIDDAETALAMIAMAIERPLRDETIVLLLDGARRGRAIVVVSGTEAPDSVVEVVECLTQGEGCEELGAVIVCTVRPPAVAAEPIDRPGDEIDDGDVDRWLEMSEIASLAGVELLEWFVVGREISCPRDLLGEPPRW